MVSLSHLLYVSCKISFILAIYGGVYDYNSYYGSMGTGGNGSTADNGTGQEGGSSSSDINNYEHDNHYGKVKTSIVSSPTYHTYPIN